MNNFLQSIKSLSPGRLASISAIFIFLIAFFVYIASSISTGEYTVLYKDLELTDAKQIVDKLEEAKVKYRLTNNGTEVLVPSDMVNKMRVETADLALPSRGSNVGYEIFDNTDALGSTNFVQNINLVRALEGELARTIRSVDNIANARVHLVLPKREMFSKDEQKPSASVVIKTRRGSLDHKSVLSIQKLVAAAVSKLEVADVAIVDTQGNLLTSADDSSSSMTSSKNESLRFDQEKKLENQITSLLEGIVGRGKVKANINIDMDFDQVVVNEEIFDPESQVVRSSSTIREEGKNSDGEKPVSVAQNIPNPDVVNNISGNSSENNRSEETINYEISKTIRNKVRTMGEIKRLTAAIMVDGITTKNEAGESSYAPRSKDEMDRITNLIKSAVGYDANRGDIIEVENLRFVENQYDNIPEGVADMLGFNKEDIIRAAEGLGVALVAILVIFLVIRPLIHNAFDASQNGEPSYVSDGADSNLLMSNFINDDDQEIDELINMNKIDGRIKLSSLKKINDVIDKNPDVSVNIIRSWLYQNNN